MFITWCFLHYDKLLKTYLEGCNIPCPITKERLISKAKLKAFEYNNRISDCCSYNLLIRFVVTFCELSHTHLIRWRQSVCLLIHCKNKPTISAYSMVVAKRLFVLNSGRFHCCIKLNVFVYLRIMLYLNSSPAALSRHAYRSGELWRNI